MARREPARYLVKELAGVTPSQASPLAVTAVTVVEYLPDLAFFRLRITFPFVPVVPVIEAGVVPLRNRSMETEAPATAFPRSSFRARVTLRCLSPVLPPTGR